MNRFLKINYKWCTLILLMIAVSVIGIAGSETNTGLGKPVGMDIYIGNVSQSASLSGSVADYQAIIDDEKYPDPESFTNLGKSTPTATPTPTPTPTPLPIATTEVPVNITGVGKSLCVLDNTSEIIVEFAFSKAGYKNTFYLAGPRYQALGWTKGDPKSYGDPLGKTWSLGTFEVGDELKFADTADMGTTKTSDDQTYYTGPASRNPDGEEHGAITLFNNTTGGTYHKYLVSYEDLLKKDWKSGEPDYNDVEFYVSGSIDKCVIEDDTEEETEIDESAAIIPEYEGMCQCYTTNSHGQKMGTGSCVAEFSYTTTVDNWEILPKTKGGDSDQPWNEFTASGNTDPVKEYRCQPDIFYVNSSINAPFWTSPFSKGNTGGSQLHWKLGSTWVSSGVCKKTTPLCPSDECSQCSS